MIIGRFPSRPLEIQFLCEPVSTNTTSSPLEVTGLAVVSERSHPGAQFWSYIPNFLSLQRVVIAVDTLAALQLFAQDQLELHARLVRQLASYRFACTRSDSVPFAEVPHELNRCVGIDPDLMEPTGEYTASWSYSSGVVYMRSD